MSAARLMPRKVRATLPLCGSPIDGEALNACRAVGRILGGAGLSYLDLAAAIPIEGEATASLSFDVAAWQAARSMPAHLYRQNRRHARTFTERQSAEHRRMALWVRNNEAGRLSERERAFIADISTMRRELSVAQADWLSAICDRLVMEARAC